MALTDTLEAPSLRDTRDVDDRADFELLDGEDVARVQLTAVLDTELANDPRVLPAVLLLRCLGAPDRSHQQFLGHQPLRRVGITAPGVDGVQADVEDVPTAETSTLFRERTQIGLHPLGVG